MSAHLTLAAWRLLDAIVESRPRWTRGFTPDEWRLLCAEPVAELERAGLIGPGLVPTTDGLLAHGRLRHHLERELARMR